MGDPAIRTDPWIGRLVGGRWRILSLLDDSGGMASVYLAQDERLPRQAVVKIPKGAALNDEFRARFARESRLHAQVSDRNVVQVLDGGEEAGTPFLVLKYLPGGNLKSWCERNASILADPRLHHDAWLLPVAQALDAVAAQGIIHRDVKPTNILFDSGGQAYLSDFGIVKGQDDGTLAKTGMLIGTVQFMSPEQCHEDKRHTLDGRSDQYGLAVTVYQVLTGWRYPVVDDTAVIYAAKFGLSPMKHPRDHDPRIPEAVNDAVMRALAPDRDQRFASSVEFAEAVIDGFGGLGERRARARRTTVAAPVEIRSLPSTERQSVATVGTMARPGFGGSAAGAGLSPGSTQAATLTTRRRFPRRLAPGRKFGLMFAAVAVSAAVWITMPFMVSWLKSLPELSPPETEGWGLVPPTRSGEVVFNSIGMRFVEIPDGAFDMGSNDPDGPQNEQPAHRVQVPRAFLMGQTEVTQTQFERVMGSSPWRGWLLPQKNVKVGPAVAATCLSWHEAVAFCDRLTERERRSGWLPPNGRYRLPTEAEWEYACRAGTKTKWSFGDDKSRLSVYGWWGGLSGDGPTTSEQYAHAVGQKEPNPWGLYDMHGNVWEWCSDEYDDSYTAAPAAAPPGRSTVGSYHVARGGAWFNDPDACRSASRGGAATDDRGDGIGFRVVVEFE